MIFGNEGKHAATRRVALCLLIGNNFIRKQNFMAGVVSPSLYFLFTSLIEFNVSKPTKKWQGCCNILNIYFRMKKPFFFSRAWTFYSFIQFSFSGDYESKKEALSMLYNRYATKIRRNEKMWPTYISTIFLCW